MRMMKGEDSSALRSLLGASWAWATVWALHASPELWLRDFSPPEAAGASAKPSAAASQLFAACLPSSQAALLSGGKGALRLPWVARRGKTWQSSALLGLARVCRFSLPRACFAWLSTRISSLAARSHSLFLRLRKVLPGLLGKG